MDKLQPPDHLQTKGLRVPCLLAKRPWIGITMMVLGAVVFALLAYNLQTQGVFLQWDQNLANTLHERALNGPQILVTLMIAAFYLGKEVVIVFVFVLGFYFFYKRFWRELIMLVVGFSGAAPIWYGLIAIFQRPRPSFEVPVWRVLEYNRLSKWSHHYSRCQLFFSGILICLKCKTPILEVGDCTKFYWDYLMDWLQPPLFG